MLEEAVKLIMRKLLVCLSVVIMLALTACSTPAPSPTPQMDASSGSLTITFDFVKQSGSASNQFAVWVEDANGQFIRTLYATKFTASGGYKSRPDSIPIWVERSGVDGVSGATPQTGAFSCVWDLKDSNGITVPQGLYKFYIEGTLRWKNQVLYSSEIEIGDGAQSVTVEGDYTYESSANQPALTDESSEHGMIGLVIAEYTPAVN
ncbi:hypothetical protein FACS1894184_13900 [Clostridia bacterium]|nr:hypothetical protein FACS1894184_13900 [Clostridia bacterium]